MRVENEEVKSDVPTYGQNKEVSVMWEWDDMAMAGLFGEMMADEELDRMLAERENEPMAPDEMLDTPWNDLDSADDF